MGFLTVVECLFATVAIFGTAIMFLEFNYQLANAYMPTVFWTPIELEYYGGLRKLVQEKYFTWAVLKHIPSDIFKKVSTWNKVTQYGICKSLPGTPNC
jgi:hypothetical protein